MRSKMSTAVTKAPRKPTTARRKGPPRKKNQYGLTPREQAFVSVLMRDPFTPTTEAAVQAGVPRDQAHKRGYEILARPRVQAELQRLKAERQAAEPVSESDVIRRLSDLAGVDVASLFQIDGQALTLRQFDALTPMQRLAIQSIEQVPTKFGVRLKVTTVDKLKAMELLGRYHGAFLDRTEVSGTITLVPSLPEPAPPPPLPAALADE